MPNNNRYEIQFHLEYQENLLQNYRSTAVTHQALTAAILMVIVSIIENYKEMNDFFKSESVFRILILFTLLALQLLIVYYGIYATSTFRKQTKRRQKNINILQNILKLEESGYLKKEMNKLKINEPIPISNIFQLIGSGYQNSPAYKNFISFTEEQISFFLEITNYEQNQTETRKKFSDVIFNIFDILWVFGASYLVIRIISIISVYIHMHI